MADSLDDDTETCRVCGCSPCAAEEQHAQDDLLLNLENTRLRNEAQVLYARIKELEKEGEMSKKHFRLLAAAIKRCKEGPWCADPVERLQREIADVCQDCDPNFDRERFNDACGGK